VSGNIHSRQETSIRHHGIFIAVILIYFVYFAVRFCPTIRSLSMKKFTLFFAATLLAISTAALAFHCPSDMKKIDAALAAGPQISAEQMDSVKKLRAEGEALHKEGKHQESLDKLGQAMSILGMGDKEKPN
jgi:hypothetical protein